MRLAEWRDKVAKLTQQQLAAQLGCSQPFISLIERAIDRQIPGAEWMVKIYQFTDGMVEPNDFYDLPVKGQYLLPIAMEPAPLFEHAKAASFDDDLQAAA